MKTILFLTLLGIAHTGYSQTMISKMFKLNGDSVYLFKVTHDTNNVVIAVDSVLLSPGFFKRRDTYSGTTNGSGNYTVTFTKPYAVAPNIQANVIGGTTEHQCRVASVSTTGFTVSAFQRTTVLSLALSTATTPLSGAAIDVTIIEK